MLSPQVVAHSATLTHALGDCAAAGALPPLPPLTCGADGCQARLAHMLNVWCSMPRLPGPAGDGDAPAGPGRPSGGEWMMFLARARGPHGPWLARHWARCQRDAHAWRCWWVALMRAADFLDMPHLYWAMMREVHLRCDDLAAAQWDALFGGALAAAAPDDGQQ